ncbi:hypothetical protein BV25DRAFT_436114 [Artomyces pyxidatus]|uniref:Uncharacterized protein n=1 Tax=Artomyces pyxidatus TaxID=48021 RepID=A0ACB8SG79_9AGAM|nr:hypothetical protein BV25DRAFT_436114 [Artomyces pyxidatus]
MSFYAFKIPLGSNHHLTLSTSSEFSTLMVSRSISARLGHIESHFLQAVTSGTEAVIAFHRDWSQLRASIDDAALKGLLEDDTAVLAHVTASRVAIIAETLLDTQVAAEEMSSTLRNELAEELVYLSPSNLPKRPLPRDDHEQDVVSQPESVATHSSTFQTFDSSTFQPCPADEAPVAYTYFSEDVEDTTPPPPTAGFKRRFEDPSVDYPSAAPRPYKRSRSHCTLAIATSSDPPHQDCIINDSSFTSSKSVGTNATALCASPSPPLSRDLPGCIVPIAAEISPSRKRRLSETDSDVSLKRPHNLKPYRLQAVSNPFPVITNNIISYEPPPLDLLNGPVSDPQITPLTLAELDQFDRGATSGGDTLAPFSDPLDASLLSDFSSCGLVTTTSSDSYKSAQVSTVCSDEDTSLRSLDGLSSLFQLPAIHHEYISPYGWSTSSSVVADSQTVSDDLVDTGISLQECDWSVLNQLDHSHELASPSQSSTSSPPFPSSPSSLCDPLGSDQLLIDLGVIPSFDFDFHGFDASQPTKSLSVYEGTFFPWSSFLNAW